MALFGAWCTVLRTYLNGWSELPSRHSHELVSSLSLAYETQNRDTQEQDHEKATGPGLLVATDRGPIAAVTYYLCTTQ